MKILVVDDDPTFTDLMVAELAAIGWHDVDVVHSGADALGCALAAGKPYDCFLLDIEMPGMDGVELCGRLSADPATQGTPIIMVSASAALEHVDNAFAKGATDYLNKPLQRRELLGRMRMVATLVRSKAEQGAVVGPANIEVRDAVSLSEASNCIDYLAMQNYLLKLGSLRMYNLIALAVNVSNLPEVFAGKDAAARKDTLMDVTEIIGESLIGFSAMISYAGYGDYVILLPRSLGYDAAVIEDQMACKLNELTEWYRNAGEVPPVVRVGTPIYRNLLSLRSPDDVLSAAIEEARASKRVLGEPPAAEAFSRTSVPSRV